MFFSTIFPIKAADIPKKKMARENAQPTAKLLIPICSAIVALNVDQQYTEPIEQCINKAGIAARIHLFSNIFVPLTKFILHWTDLQYFTGQICND